MDIKQTLRQYKDKIVIAGIATGAISLLDHSGLFEVGLQDWGKWFLYAALAISGLSMYVFNTFYMGKKKVRTAPTQQHQVPVNQQKDTVQRLREVAPPEELKGYE